MKEITEIDILRTAKNYIEQYGWIQGESGNKESGFCSLGAADRAGIDIFSEKQGTDDLFSWVLPWGVMEKAANCLDDEARNRGAISIVRYNDAPGRTKQDIIAVFNMAIEMAINERISKGN